jgi:hypothetical protein
MLPLASFMLLELVILELYSIRSNWKYAFRVELSVRSFKNHLLFSTLYPLPGSILIHMIGSIGN